MSRLLPQGPFDIVAAVAFRGCHSHGNSRRPEPTMLRMTAKRVSSQVALSGTLLAASLVSVAANVDGMTPVTGGPQIVLYLIQSFGSGGKSLRLYGLRIDEIHPIPNSPLVTTVGLVQRRELVNLQIVPHSDIRIQLGKRLSWDFTSEEFGPQSSFSRMTIGIPITGIERSPADNLPPWDPRTSPTAMPRNMAGDTRAGGMSLTLLTTVVTFPGKSNAAEIMPPNWRLRLDPVNRVCTLASC
jgi:hypothetical protein